MKPEDRRRLKQHIDMIVNHNAPSVTFCPNCECERETTLYSEVRECTVCREGFEVVCGIKPSNSDASTTQDVLTDIKTPSSIENTNPDYYKDSAVLIVKRCPFCGIPPKVWSYGEKKLTRCLTDGCPMAEAELDVYLDAWNNRPEEQRLFEVIKNKQMIIDGGKHMGDTINPNIGKMVWFTRKSINARGDVYATDRVIGELIGLYELKALVKDNFGQVFIVPADDLKFCEL